MSSRRNEMRSYKTKLRGRRRRHDYYSQQFVRDYERRVREYLNAREAAINKDCESCSKFATCAINFSIMF